MNVIQKKERKNAIKFDPVEPIKDIEMVFDLYKSDPDADNFRFSEGESIDDNDSSYLSEEEVKTDFTSEKKGKKMDNKMMPKGESKTNNGSQVITTLNSKDNFLNSEDYIDFFNNLKWVCGSVNLTTYVNKEGLLKKKPVYPGSWTKPVYRADFNSSYFLTGKVNNMVVLDLDEMEDPECQEMSKMADEVCTMVVQTRKGMHYYFLYEDDLGSKKQGIKNNKIIWDLQSTGQMIYCPPSSYIDCQTNEKHEYKLLKCGPLVPMPDKIKKIVLNKTKNETKKETKKEKKNDMMEILNKVSNSLKKSESEPIVEKDPVKKMLFGLHPKRSTNTDSWVHGGYCLKNSGYDVDYFDYFSSLHYASYNKNEVHKKFHELKSRNYQDKKLTIATMWMWLKEDNPEEFNKLKILQNPKAYEIDLKDYDRFRINIFRDILIKDNKELGNDFLLTFEDSRSYKYFNHFHIKNYKRDAIFDISRDTPIAYTDKGLKDFYVYHAGNKKQFIHLWGESPSTKQISDFIFKPNRDYVQQEDEINLFTGFKYETESNDGNYDEAFIKPFLDHLKNNLCNKKEDVADYVLNWIAHIIQKPHIRTEVIIFFYSHVQGVGKNIFTNILAKIFGKYYLKLENMDEFTTQFNSNLQNRLLSVMDELSARSRTIDNELKNATTRTTVGITYKGHEKFFMDDHNNFMFTTNNEQVLKVPKDDRRLMIIECREKVLEEEMIVILVKLMNNEDFLRQVFNFFMKRNISNFRPQKLIVTEYKETLMMNDLPAYIRMIKDKAKEFEGEVIKAKDIYLRSKIFAKENNISAGYSDQRCYKDLKKYFAEYLDKKNTRVSQYVFPRNLEDVVDEVVLNGLRTK